MTDNEKIDQLLASILAAVNAAQLPLGVKALALENILFRVRETMRQTEVTGEDMTGKEEQQE